MTAGISGCREARRAATYAPMPCPQDDVIGRDVTARDNVGERRLGVGLDRSLRWMPRAALTVTAIVECEDAETRLPELREARHRAGGERAITFGKEEHQEVAVAIGGLGGQPKARELRPAGAPHVEVHGLHGHRADPRRKCGPGLQGMQDKLPLSLEEQSAEGEVPAENRDCYGEEEGPEEPPRRHRFRSFRLASTPLRRSPCRLRSPTGRRGCRSVGPWPTGIRSLHR